MKYEDTVVAALGLTDLTWGSDKVRRKISELAPLIIDSS